MKTVQIPSYSPHEINAIAYYQKKTLLWFAIRFFVSGVLVVVFLAISGQGAALSQPSTLIQGMNTLLQVAHWSISGVMFYYLFYLSKSLGFFSKPWILWIAILAAFIVGILGLIFIMIAIVQANRALKAKGIRIGFFGADSASLAEYLSQNPNESDVSSPLL